MKKTSATSNSRSYVQSARAQAAEETGQRVVDAFLALLMTEWFDKITLDRVAENAGVTVQTVVRRFGGKEGLLGEAVKVLTSQINARRAVPPGDAGRMVDALMKDYEQVGDAIVRLLALEPRHAALRDFLNYGRNEHRTWVSAVFAHELAALESAERRRALDALVIVTDVYTWKLLRRDMGRGIPESRATMKQLVGSTIAAHLKPQPTGEDA